MGQIRIEIDDELHQALRQRALDQGLSLKETVMAALERAVKEGKKR